MRTTFKKRCSVTQLLQEGLIFQHFVDDLEGNCIQCSVPQTMRCSEFMVEWSNGSLGLVYGESPIGDCVIQQPPFANNELTIMLVTWSDAICDQNLESSSVIPNAWFSQPEFRFLTYVAVKSYLRRSILGKLEIRCTENKTSIRSR